MDPPQETEAELERFRRQWQEEVSKKARKAGQASGNSASTGSVSASTKTNRRKQAGPAASAPSKHVVRNAEHDDIDPQAYHDLPDNEADLRLDAADHGLARGSSSTSSEPNSALEHYEWAVEKETQGSLGDSLKHYRRAFKVRRF